MSRVLLRAFCNRPRDAHTLATIYAGTNGNRVVEFRQAVHGSGVTAQLTTEALGDRTIRNLFCSSCGKEFVLLTSTILQALDDGGRATVTQPLGMWLDPVGVTSRRNNAGH